MLFATVNPRGEEINIYDFHKCALNEETIIKILNDNQIKIINISNDTLDDLSDNPYKHNLNMLITGEKNE